MPQTGNTNLARVRALVVLSPGKSGLPGALCRTLRKWSVLLDDRHVRTEREVGRDSVDCRGDVVGRTDPHCTINIPRACPVGDV